MDPAGGFGAVGVDELDAAAVGVGEAGFHDGYDDLAAGEGRHDLGGGVEDEVVVGAGGDDAAVEDEGLGFFAGGEAGAGEDVGEQGAGVVFVGFGVGVVDVDGGLGQGEEVFEGEGGDASLKGDVEGFRGWNGGLFHAGNAVVVGRGGGWRGGLGEEGRGEKAGEDELGKGAHGGSVSPRAVWRGRQTAGSLLE